MEESLIMEKFFRNSDLNTKVSYFIDRNKTWDIEKLNEIIPKCIMDKLISISVPIMILRLKLCGDLLPMKKFQLKQQLGQIMIESHPS